MPTNITFNTMPQSIRPPCTKDCPNRTPGCGSTCLPWLDYVRQRNEIYKQRAIECNNKQTTQRGTIEYNKAPVKKRK